jgi:hypothetical protein
VIAFRSRGIEFGRRFIAGNSAPIRAASESGKDRPIPRPVSLGFDQREQESLQRLPLRARPLQKRVPHILRNIANLQSNHACILHAQDGG